MISTRPCSASFLASSTVKSTRMNMWITMLKTSTRRSNTSIELETYTTTNNSSVRELKVPKEHLTPTPRSYRVCLLNLRRKMAFKSTNDDWSKESKGEIYESRDWISLFKKVKKEQLYTKSMTGNIFWLKFSFERMNLQITH